MIPPHPPSRTLSRFLRAEDGVMTILGVMVFLLILLAGGVALDFMRFEERRAHLQYTLDRGVLAAASLRQVEDREIVIQNYLRAAGLDPDAVVVSGEEGVNFRTVRGRIDAPVDTLFLNMLGIDRLIAPAASEASERIQKVEISLVLDVSGSMGARSSVSGRTKMAEMQEAAKAFVTEVLTDRRDLVSVSLIPYNHAVNLGSTLDDYYALDATHAFSSCARFTAADYGRTDIPTDRTLRRLAPFDPNWHGENRNSGWWRYWHWFSEDGQTPRPECPMSDQARILAWSNDIAALHDAIDALRADGRTAIDLGMKWGVALLDLSARTRLNAMVEDGHVAEAFRDRPHDYRLQDVLKIVVVMTDGENTTRYDVKADKRPASSGVYAFAADFPSLTIPQRRARVMRDAGDLTFSLWDSEARTFRPENGTASMSAPVGGANAYQLTTDELFVIRAQPYVHSFMAAGMSNAAKSRWTGTNETVANDTGADANLASVCAAARGADVITFAIGFQAPAGGRHVMKTCASSDAHYYDIEGDTPILTAFSDIARVINQLKLTQ
ncbi:VWA domain-containing protein [Jannaschia sp. LMIT008]|uniref:VWA domain-containing protein n=1 Tax=Jannaschia maritima TaxID=3032585 RepID=UPI00281105E5|nr:VWA domain-containing protein [Jannaschia sp. LMIT008]